MGRATANGTARELTRAMGGGLSARGRLALVVVCGAVFLAIPETLVRLFTSDAATIALGAQLVRVAAAFQLFDGVQGVAAGALRGAADVRFPFVANVAAHWLVGFPLALFLVLVFMSLAYGAGTHGNLTEGLWEVRSLVLGGVVALLIPNVFDRREQVGHLVNLIAIAVVLLSIETIWRRFTVFGDLPSGKLDAAFAHETPVFMNAVVELTILAYLVNLGELICDSPEANWHNLSLAPSKSRHFVNGILPDTNKYRNSHLRPCPLKYSSKVGLFTLSSLRK